LRPKTYFGIRAFNSGLFWLVSVRRALQKLQHQKSSIVAGSEPPHRRKWNTGKIDTAGLLYMENRYVSPADGFKEMY